VTDGGRCEEQLIRRELEAAMTRSDTERPEIPQGGGRDKRITGMESGMSRAYVSCAKIVPCRAGATGLSVTSRGLWERHSCIDLGSCPVARTESAQFKPRSVHRAATLGTSRPFKWADATGGVYATPPRSPIGLSRQSPI